MTIKQGLTIFLYDFVFFVFALLYIPVLIIKGKWHKDFLTRFGSLDSKALGLDHRDKIWIHAVSVGEVLVAKSLIQAIRQRFFDYQIIISTATKTGYQLAQSSTRPKDVVIFAPLDFSFAVRAYIKALNPCIFINTETEIWPNLLTALGQKGIPIVQVNGRISDGAFLRYQRVGFLIKPILKHVRYFCMQTDQDAARIEALGACADRISVMGNMKFDDIPQSSDILLKGLQPPMEADLFVAGSTHAGEEEIVLDVFAQALKQHERLRLVLVPRHPERADEICSLVVRKGFIPVKFSVIAEFPQEQSTVIVVDTIGHLRAFYHLATLVFVGKSLTAQGGQNIIEPAYFAKPVIVGPFMQNFRDVAQLFLSRIAIVQVKNNQELLMAVLDLLGDASKRAELGYRARKVVEEQAGSVDKTIRVISEVLA